MRVLEGYQKGINLGGWLSQRMSREKEHLDTFITEEDIRKLAEWGFDHVRLPLDYDVIETEDGDSIEDGYRHIDDCMDWCRKYGLHLMIDLHKAFGYMFDRSAVPDPDRFFTEEALQERFYGIWEKLSARYGKEKDHLLFELLNEVVDAAYAKEWNRIASRAVEVIRKQAPDIGIVIGGVQYNSAAGISLLDPPADENIIYTFHCYEPLCFTHQKAYWIKNFDFSLPYPADADLYREKCLLLDEDHAETILDKAVKEVGTDYFRYMFREAVDIAERRNVPLYCGEYGVIDQAPLEDTLRWLADINHVFQEYKIGRAIWTYKKMSFGLTDDHYRDKKDEMIRLITS